MISPGSLPWHCNVVMIHCSVNQRTDSVKCGAQLRTTYAIDFYGIFWEFFWEILPIYDDLLLKTRWRVNIEKNVLRNDGKMDKDILIEQKQPYCFAIAFYLHIVYYYHFVINKRIVYYFRKLNFYGFPVHFSTKCF